MLNDVTMLLHISQDHSHVEVVSFPRDMPSTCPSAPTRTTRPSRSRRLGVKLNSILHDGGFDCVASTIEQLLGVQIPVGGIVEFDGVAALSEAVGGVEVCLVDASTTAARACSSTPGTHSLKGYDALAFLRTRHGVGDGSDLGRISSQQTFLASLARTCSRAGTLADPDRLYSIAKADPGEHDPLEGPAGCRPARVGRPGAAGHRPRQDRLHPVPDGVHRRHARRWSGRIRAGGRVGAAEGRPGRVRPAATGNASYGTVTERPTPRSEPTDAAAPSAAAPDRAIRAPGRAGSDRRGAARRRHRADAQGRCATANSAERRARRRSRHRRLRTLSGACWEASSECASARIGACPARRRRLRGASACGRGGLSERPMELVLKTSGQQCLVGSNPTPSAPRRPTTRGGLSEPRARHQRAARRSPCDRTSRTTPQPRCMEDRGRRSPASVVAVVLVSERRSRRTPRGTSRRR